MFNDPPQTSSLTGLIFLSDDRHYAYFTDEETEAHNNRAT